MTSANQIDPNLKAPMTDSFVDGRGSRADAPLRAAGELQLHAGRRTCSATSRRTSRRVWVSRWPTTPPGRVLTGTLPDGATYSVPTFVANGAKVIAGGGGFLTTTVPGYSTDYHGLELALVKRMSNGWMGRVGFSYNNARDHFASEAGRYDTNGNPTPTANEPLVDGGQFAPSSSASSGSGSVYVNAKWQFNANGDVPGAVWHRGQRQRLRPPGLSVPAVPPQALGGESLSVLVTPTVDYFRYDNVWDTDVRAGAGVQVPDALGARDWRPLQRRQREHGAGPEQQHPGDDVQPDWAEPEPADLPDRC